jgi:hypothetical protein
MNYLDPSLDILEPYMVTLVEYFEAVSIFIVRFVFVVLLLFVLSDASLGTKSGRISLEPHTIGVLLPTLRANTLRSFKDL